MSEEVSEWRALEFFASRLDAVDDCAVLPRPSSGDLVLTTDMLHRDADLPEGVTPYTTGWRVAAVNFSDVAAMAGEPLALVVAAGQPEFHLEFLEEFVDGVEDCCGRVGAEYVGGDLDGHDEETYAGTALGVADPPVLREGASAGDRVYVTGKLCRTAVALRLFDEGVEEAANELFRFTPRVKEALSVAADASAMTDVSDGVAVSLHQLAEASGVGFDVRSESLPLVEGAEFDDVYFGGDYELLFTVPEDVELDLDDGCYSEIGVLRERESGVADVRLDGEEMPKEGYSH